MNLELRSNAMLNELQILHSTLAQRCTQFAADLAECRQALRDEQAKMAILEAELVALKATS